MLILVKRANYGSRLYANFPPLCLVTVAMRRVCLGRLSYMVLTAKKYGNRFTHQISQVQVEDNRF